MKNKPSIGELFEALEVEIGLMKEGNNGNENIGKIKVLSLMLEERVNALYRQLKWKRKSQEKSEILESGNETCVCGQSWVYEEAGLCETIGLCRDEYCIVNVKREA